MKRLRKLSDRPRENNKKVEFLCKLSLTINTQTGTARDELLMFKDWVANRFTQWDKSILDFFLYEYNLKQDPDGKKYKIDFRIEDIVKDDSEDTENKEEFIEDSNKNSDKE